ncbi:MAG: hypothetical protein IPM53_25015 [Anaerolineaceae bacterium]|nr:hypothetical protein [Anaerolineaceae bacterium]
MIARYGLRRLAPEEQQVFPGLRLVLAVFKVGLIKPPSAVRMSLSPCLMRVKDRATEPGGCCQR